VCGCISSPPHIPWPQDGKCYPLYTQGPCQEGYQLSISTSFSEPSCTPALCGNERSILWSDGQCYRLGSQGPCQDVELLTIHHQTLKPHCQVVESQVKRVFDMLPGGFIRDGPVSVSLKAKNCLLDRRGRCRNSFRSRNISKKRNKDVYVRRRSSQSYINFLKQFRRT